MSATIFTSIRNVLIEYDKDDLYASPISENVKLINNAYKQGSKVILTSPKTNIEQAVGRILRQDAKDRKFVPLIIDIFDEFSLFAKQAQKRVKFYQKNNYKMEVYVDNILQEEETKSLNVKSSRKKTGKFKQIPVEELDFLPDDD